MTVAVFTGACLSGSIGNSNLKGALYFQAEAAGNQQEVRGANL